MDRHRLRSEEIFRTPVREMGGVRSGAAIHKLLGHDGTCDVYLLRADDWYDRHGIYCDADYVPFSDETVRAAFFGGCVADWLGSAGGHYDVIHGNDWQSGPLMLHLRSLFPSMPQVFTINNAMYQGDLRHMDLEDLGLPDEQRLLLQCRAKGEPNLLLAGLLAADAVTTCSPGYALEIEAEFQGTPIGDALGRLGTMGTVFGVDGALWDPAASGRSSVPYDAGSVDEGKAINTRHLRMRFGLRDDIPVPMVGVCTRLVPAKGSDLLLEALAPLIRQERLQVALIGPSTTELREVIVGLQGEAPGLLGYTPLFDQDDAWLLYAGSDFTVMPSLTEPCGLNQLIAFRYGTIPLVTPVGGLRDTVVDLMIDPESGNGLIIPEASVEAVRATVLGALDWMAASPGAVTRVRRRVMALDWSWDRTAQNYAALYGRLVESNI